MPNDDNSDAVGLMFFIGSATPIVTIGILYILDWFHTMSGGGEFSLGAILSIIVIPILIIVVLLIQIIALCFALYFRKPWLLFLAAQQVAIFITYGTIGSNVISLMLSLDKWILAQQLILSISSMYFVIKNQYCK